MTSRVLLLACALIAVPAITHAGANYGPALLGGAAAISTKTNCASMARSVCWNVNPNWSGAPGTTCAVGVYVGYDFGGGSMTAVDFGVYYNPAEVRIDAWTRCGDLEAPQSGWPAGGKGNTVVWGSCQTVPEVKLVGFFSVYLYAGARMTLGVHPAYGVARTLDCLSNLHTLWVPAVLALSGQSGGHNPACHGTPVTPTTWGSIKSLYLD
jgi:hypothetical protein